MKVDLGALFRPQPPADKVVNIRVLGKPRAVLLTHGFTGEILSSWDGFYQGILNDPALDEWDVFGVAYPSSKSVDRLAFLRGDPSLETLALSFRTTLKLPPFEVYAQVAVAAHSMGGLFVQRALLDDPELTARVSHVFLYGTPSRGLAKATLISPFKKQGRDMRPESEFIRKLREDWDSRFAGDFPFSLTVIAGDIDEFVSTSSSLDPFPDQNREVAVGDHSTIVRPTASSRQGLDLLRRALGGGPAHRGPMDLARLNLEAGLFQSVVDALIPNVAEIDEAALSSLALALDGLGRGDEALTILEQHYRDDGIGSTEAAGILAGRIKRRWLVERKQSDLDRASQLYSEGYLAAAAANDHEQGYYHAINLAFLDLVSAPLNSKAPARVSDMAEKAIWHCARSPMSNWRVATEAEAELVLGHREKALALYTEAVAATDSNRQLGSMYSQASRIAERLYGSGGLEAVKVIFDRFRD